LKYLIIPQSKYLDHNWGLTKFCVAQFKAPHITIKKQDATQMRQALAHSKGFSGMAEVVGSWTGKEEFDEIAQSIEQHPPRDHRMLMEPAVGHPDDDELATTTPPDTQNPEPPGSGAPFMPNTYRFAESAMLSGHDAVTPTPGGGVAAM
jgi:tRNA-dihydrouridine synthase 2